MTVQSKLHGCETWRTGEGYWSRIRVIEMTFLQVYEGWKGIVIVECMRLGIEHQALGVNR